VSAGEPFRTSFDPTALHQRLTAAEPSGILRHIVEQNAPHRTIMTLSPGIYPFWPMLNYIDGRMTMRYLTMWVLQGIYADCEDFPALYNAPETMSDTEKYIFDVVSEDFANGKPDLLIVDVLHRTLRYHRRRSFGSSECGEGDIDKHADLQCLAGICQLNTRLRRAVRQWPLQRAGSDRAAVERCALRQCPHRP